MTDAGFPHSDIYGSMLTSSSPQLFAGSRVLLRQIVPRHSLYALINLICVNFCFKVCCFVFAYFVVSSILLDETTTFFRKNMLYYPVFKEQLSKDQSPNLSKLNRISTHSPTFEFQPSFFSFRTRYFQRLLSPQKGGDPSPRSRRDTLLRLNPNHQSYLRRLPPCGQDNDFEYYQLSWFDGRCVQTPGTYSPRHG